jgi:hypothetical protein
VLPAAQIRVNLAAKRRCLHGSKRDTAALTAMHQRIAPTPRGALRLAAKGRSLPLTGLRAGTSSRHQSIFWVRKKRCARFTRISTAIHAKDGDARKAYEDLKIILATPMHEGLAYYKAALDGAQ